MATKKRLIVCPVCGREKVTVGVTCSIRCSRQYFPQKFKHPDPTEEEIAAAREKIQETWTDSEERQRTGSNVSPPVEFKTVQIPNSSFNRRGFEVNHGDP